MAELVQFLLGVALLCVGANWLVKGAAVIADAFKIPKTVVGLTLVALGTSAPEFFVNVLAALEGKTSFALSNVSGSNLANMCVGFGVCAIFASVQIRRKAFGSDVSLNLLIPIVLIGLMLSDENHNLPLLVVAPLTGMLLYYLYSLVGRESAEIDAEPSASPIGVAIALFLLGLLALYFGGEWVLHAAINTAQNLNVSEDVIALTVVALGTSVPDITASVVAARRQEHGIAVGNIIGSNISNLLVVLNSTIAVHQQALATNPGIRWDYIAVTVAAGFCWALVVSKERIPRWAGFVFIVGYVGYLVFRVATL